MKTKRTLIIGVVLGALIGWALGFLRLPYIENNFSFFVGFAAAVSLGIIVWLIWAKNSFIGKGQVIQDSKKSNKLSLLVMLFIVLGGLVSGFLLYKQKELLEAKTQDQNKKIQEMAELLESVKESNQLFLKSNILNNVDEELKNNPNRMLSDVIITRIATLSFSLKPYRYFDGDSVSQKMLSPEKGQLLLALCKMKIDSSSFEKIKLGASFSGADLRGADLHGIDLSGADFKGADLGEADLSGANFSGANMKGANLWGANLNDANFNGADLKRADLSWAELNRTNFIDADLNGVNLTSAQLRNANLKGTKLQWADLEGAMLNEANLEGADLEGADLKKTNFTKANLSEVNLKRANLTEANLIGAELAKADVGENWLKELNQWRTIGAEEIQKRYTVVNDSIDKWKKPIYHLKKIEDGAKVKEVPAH